MHNVSVLGGSGLVGKAVINEMSKNPQFQAYGTYFKNRAALNQHRSFNYYLGKNEETKGNLIYLNEEEMDNFVYNASEKIQAQLKNVLSDKAGTM